MRQGRIAEQTLFGRAAAAAQSVTLAQGERGALQLFLHAAREGEIEVVSAQQDVVADGGAFEVQLAVRAAGADQAEVGGAAADVAD